MAGEDFCAVFVCYPFHRPITLRCAHSFCRHCIMKALKSSPHCPYVAVPHSYEDLFEYSENKLLKKLTSAFKNETLVVERRSFLKKRASKLEKESLVWEKKKKNRKVTRTEEKASQFGFWKKFSFISPRFAFFFCSWPFWSLFPKVSWC